MIWPVIILCVIVLAVVAAVVLTERHKAKLWEWEAEADEAVEWTKNFLNEHKSFDNI